MIYNDNTMIIAMTMIMIMLRFDWVAMLLQRFFTVHRRMELFEFDVPRPSRCVQKELCCMGTSSGRWMLPESRDATANGLNYDPEIQ